MKRRLNWNALTCKITALLLAVMLCMHLCTGFTVNAQEPALQSDISLSNPTIENAPSLSSEQKATWDCVWFGSYPQAEVVPSAESYTGINKIFLRSGALIENSSLYEELKNAPESEWNENNDITLNGNKYRRMTSADATFAPPGRDEYYNWADSYEYHYFKFEPIKWRVLKVNGNQALLLSDQALDDRQFNTKIDEAVTWETSPIRNWLNGYEGNGYSSNNFIETAFSSDEASAIEATTIENDGEMENGTENEMQTADKIFLLSKSDTYGSEAVSYGFVSSDSIRDEARISRSSTYAKAMGVSSYPYDDYTGNDYKGNCGWWLRSSGEDSTSIAYVNYFGEINADGTNATTINFGIRAALNLNLSWNLHSYAGTVSSDGSENEIGGGDGGNTGDNGNGGSDLRNPAIENSSGSETERKVTWDCVWFGSYPQAEIVTSADSYDAIEESMLNNGDLIVDSSLYDELENASEWNLNDITIGENKYRRMKKIDATCSSESNGYYKWPDSDEYRYFKYEPIKWRVLKVNGNQALLLSDLVLDARQYSYSWDAVTSGITWENSTIRSWLNGYSGTENKLNYDFRNRNFIKSAFTSNERLAIADTYVENAAHENGTSGGNPVKDKIFFLSETEVYGNDAVSYGFASSGSVNDEARISKSSAYAKAMGVFSSTEEDYKGNCWWWLRSPGDTSERAANVHYEGHVENSGDTCDVIIANNGVRAALNLNLSSKLYTYAGTVSYGEENDTSKLPPEGEKPSNQTDGTVKVSKITILGISKKIAAGKKIKLTANIMPLNASNQAVTWSTSNKNVATVNSLGVVTMKKKSGGKSVTITAAAQDGSGVKAVYKIKSMKGVVKKVAISGKKSVKAGKTLKLKAKVTATKNANKKLKWTSSNQKYATVSSSGKVKALKAGKGKTVKITAMATDGSNKKKSVTIRIE